MLYYLIRRQSGGCDYTIGCGLAITKLQATTAEEARQEAAKDIGSTWRAQNESGIESAELLTVAAVEDLAPHLDRVAQERAARKAAKAAAKQEQAEREQLEKLKAKYG